MLQSCQAKEGFDLDINQENSGKLFFPDPAERFGSHSQHRGNVLQRHLVEEFFVRSEESFVALFRRHGKVAENPVFQDGEAACNE